MNISRLDEVRQGGLRVFVGGEGRPVLLLHGLGGAARNWERIARELTARHRVVAPDLPGHGGSEPLARGAGLEAFVECLDALLSGLRAAPALVAGHSFGAQLGLALAARRPELVRGLLTVSPSGIQTRKRSARALVRVTGLVRPGRRIAPLRHRYAGSRWFRRTVFGPWFVSDADTLEPETVLAFLDPQREHRDTRTAARAMVAYDPRPDLGRVRCPALVLWGARDPQLPVADAFEFARRLGAPVRVVADCGHLVIGERPDAVLDGIRYLDELPLETEPLG